MGLQKEHGRTLTLLSSTICTRPFAIHSLRAESLFGLNRTVDHGMQHRSELEMKEAPPESFF